MQGDEAKDLIGFLRKCHLLQFQLETAYKRKAWETQPAEFFQEYMEYMAESKLELLYFRDLCEVIFEGESFGHTQALDAAGGSRTLQVSQTFDQFKSVGCELSTFSAIEEMVPPRSTGSTDPGWEHGVAQDEKKKKVKCNYCGKIVSGGIYRLKQHLARLSGEVTYCTKASEEVYQKMKENLEGYRVGKKPKPEDEEEGSPELHSNDDFDDEEEATEGNKSKGKQVTDDKNMVLHLTPLRSMGFVDPGWEHGVAQDERKKKVKCNYCEKIVSGGINRFKQHLARIPGEVAYCQKAPEEVYLKMKENMKWHRTGRRQRRTETKEVAAFYMPSDNDEDDEDEGLVNGRSKETQDVSDKSITGNNRGTRKRYRGRSPNSRTGSEQQLKKLKFDTVMKSPKSQASLSCKQMKAKAGSDKKARKEVNNAICKFFYHSALPFNVANSPYFHKMLELVGQYGHGLNSPTDRMIAGRFLHDEIATIKEHHKEFTASWTVTGCTIMADSWKNVQDRVVVNFLVSCPRGVYFVSSVDATDILEDAPSLYQMLDKVVQDVGEENVVQVITEDTANYRIAGKMLEEKRKSLFWTPCAAYCIDRILEDFVKIKMVGECMGKGKRITKFIYNRPWLLNLMKKEYTFGRELVRPAVTRSATDFLNLQSLLEHRNGLKRLFQSEKWVSSSFAKLDEGKEIEKIVLNTPIFWKKLQFVKKSVDPILQVLLKVDSELGLSMASVYNDMYRAKLAIKAIHGDDERKYGPYWTVVDSHWNLPFLHPLYVAAYFLNPSYRYRSDFLAHPEVIRGLNECIVRLEPDTGRRVAASMQITEFVSAKADFGTELAVSTRTELDPAAWWQQHGINCLELQRIAVRILSQTCSSFGCEHNWSTFDQIHSQRRNRIAQKRLNDLMYVHYNLRLRERQLRKKLEESVSLDNVLVENLLDEWVVEVEKPAFQEDEDILYGEMEQVEADDIEGTEIEDIDAEARREAMETGILTVVEPLDVQPPLVASNEDEDDDLDFLDEDFADS